MNSNKNKLKLQISWNFQLVPNALLELFFLVHYITNYKIIHVSYFKKSYDSFKKIMLLKLNMNNRIVCYLISWKT